MTGIERIPDELLEITRLDSVLTHRLPGEHYEASQVALSALTGSLPLLIRKAAAAEYADSWRLYNVGAAGIAYNLQERRMGILTGVNVKPKEYGALNVHAEAMLIAKARKHRLNRIFALSVWGAPEANTPTLHPCHLCRHMLASATVPEITPQTLLLSGNKDYSICEYYTIDRLNSHHTQPTGESQPLPRMSLTKESLQEDERTSWLMWTMMEVWARLYPENPTATAMLQTKR